MKWSWSIVAVIATGICVAGHQSAEAFTTANADPVRATFSICGKDRHITCIVDGDTFWLRGERFRIADIDAPEINPPRCEAERIRGEAAKRRLGELLNAGPFPLVARFRGEDQYGRKLPTVMREGRSIGGISVRPGLARWWDDPAQSWCGMTHHGNESVAAV